MAARRLQGALLDPPTTTYAQAPECARADGVRWLTPSGKGAPLSRHAPDQGSVSAFGRGVVVRRLADGLAYTHVNSPPSYHPLLLK